MKKELTVELTNRCPLNCIHCSTKYSPLYENKKCLSSDTILGMAINIINSEPETEFNIRLSGGEPTITLSEYILSNIRSLHNVDKIIITTSGYYGIHFEPPKKTVLRFSLYGNKKEHENITQTKGSYEAIINSIRYSLRNGYKVELTTPIFDREKLLSVISFAKDYKLPVRIAKLIAYNGVEPLPAIEQLKIAEDCKEQYKYIDVTCSLKDNCHIACDYPKINILATGQIIKCAIDKRGI